MFFFCVDAIFKSPQLASSTDWELEQSQRQLLDLRNPLLLSEQSLLNLVHVYLALTFSSEDGGEDILLLLRSTACLLIGHFLDFPFFDGFMSSSFSRLTVILTGSPPSPCSPCG